MVLEWVPFKIVSDIPALHSRWLMLLKIEISSIVHCCFSLNQNELKKNYCSYIAKEQFNIYSGFFCEIFLSTDFYRLCKLEKRGDEIFKKSPPWKLLSQYQPNFAKMILGWPPSKKIVSVDPDFQPRWPPSSKQKKGGMKF